jgi:HAD superfamily hydrolase (TIGR01509 family)
VSTIAAIIFDLDDTLLASTSTWVPAETALLARLGRTYDHEMAKHYVGLNARDVGRVMWDLVRPASMTREACAEAMRELLISNALQAELRPMAGAAELLAALRGRVPLALASGSPPELLTSVCQRLGWDKTFSVVISSESVARGKPAPDVFLAAAAKLGVEPTRAMVIEDSVPGVAAAVNAAMPCLAVNQPERWPRLSGARQCFQDLHEVRSYLIPLLPTAVGSTPIAAQAGG